MQSALAAALLATASATGATAEPIRYEFDKSHTAIRTTWDHWGFTRQSIEFTNYDGVLLLDFADPRNSTVEVTFQLKDGYWVGAANKDLFERLASPLLLDIARFATIKFKATAFETKNKVTGVMRGELTIKGHTRPVVLDVRLNRRELLSGADVDRAGFSAVTKLDRSLWGIDFGLPNVCCELDITIETELVGPPAAPNK
jgi:polyisoprenoid-binding protein YceI